MYAPRVHGMNRPDGHRQIIACATCTTNCIAPVVEVAQRRRGVKRSDDHRARLHASQRLVDSPSSSFRRGPAGAVNLVPASTGATRATIKAVPELAGRFDGIAIRAPILAGSINDIVVVTSKATTAEAVNDVFAEEAETERYRGILDVSRDPPVSSDIIGDSRASVVDPGPDPGGGRHPGQDHGLVRQRVGLHALDGPGSPNQPRAPCHR
jgi:glyceraldehyde 3-phosphate dehydrogenase